MPRIVPHDATLIPKTAERVFSGVVFDVYQWPQKLYDGSTTTFEMLKRPDTVVFLAIADDKAVFIREQQPGRPEHVRLPGGRVDAGENWLEAAKRECSEEIGMSFKTWRLINVRQPIIKVEWFVATYIATDLIERHSVKHDAGEKITLVPMSFDEAKRFELAAQDPLNEYTQNLFRKADSLEDIVSMPAFEGKEVV